MKTTDSRKLLPKRKNTLCIKLIYETEEDRLLNFVNCTTAVQNKTMLNILYPLLLQLPIGTRNPDDNNPIDLTSPFDVIVYIILPILMVVFYILWRKKKKEDEN